MIYTAAGRFPAKAADTVREHGAGLTPTGSKEDHMEAIEDGTANPLEYHQCQWGDYIKGTKRQIQSLGIGLRSSFPGDPGAPKLKVATLDPRGYGVTIHADHGGRFCVYIHFPGWPESPGTSRENVPGLQGVTVERVDWLDVYRGPAIELVAAGIVRPEQIPGPHNGRKHCAGWLPDGSLCGQGHKAWQVPGGIWISRRPSDRLEVKVYVPSEEGERRSSASRQARMEWEQLVASMPRPAKLEPLPQWQLNRLAAGDIQPSSPCSNVVDMRAWRAKRVAHAPA